MKKITIIAVCLLTFGLYSCSHSSSGSSSTSVTPTSSKTWSYDMTIAGHSYHRSGYDTGMYHIWANIGSFGGGTGPYSQLSLVIFDNDIMTDGNGQSIFAFKNGDTTSKTGSYSITDPAASITDAGNPNGCNNFNNTNDRSTITITLATLHEIKGTINFNGYNGCDTSSHNITGDFDYNY